MKNKILSIILLLTMVLSIAACGDKNTTNVTDISDVNTVTEATNEIASKDTIENTTEVTIESAANITVEETMPADYKSKIFEYTYKGASVKIEYPDYKNKYVEMIHEAGFGVGRYDNAAICIDSNGAIYMINDKSSTENYYYLGFEDAANENDAKEHGEIVNSIANNLLNNSSEKLVDLNNDGIISNIEVKIIAEFLVPDKDFVGVMLYNE